MGGTFISGLGLVVQLGKGSLASSIGHSEDVLAGLGPALVRDTNSPGIVLVSGAKLVGTACRGGV